LSASEPPRREALPCCCGARAVRSSSGAGRDLLQDIELELLLALLLTAPEPAAEDLQEGGASSEGDGQAGDDAVPRVRSYATSAIAGCSGRHLPRQKYANITDIL
jgi:hypothetical protein